MNLDTIVSMRDLVAVADRVCGGSSTGQLRRFGLLYFDHVHHPLVKHADDTRNRLQQRHPGDACPGELHVGLRIMDELNHIFPFLTLEALTLRDVISAHMDSGRENLDALRLFKNFLTQLWPKDLFIQDLLLQYRFSLNTLVRGINSRWKDSLDLRIDIDDEKLATESFVGRQDVYDRAFDELLANVVEHVGPQTKVAVAYRATEADLSISFSHEAVPGFQPVGKALRPGKGLSEAASLLRREGDFLMQTSAGFSAILPRNALFPLF